MIKRWKCSNLFDSLIHTDILKEVQFKNKIVNILLIYKNILSNEIEQFAPMMRETIKK